MKKTTKIFIVLAIAIAFVGYKMISKDSSDNTEFGKADIETLSDKNDSINKVVIEKVLKEPKVKDAIITDANVLYVSVINDGTNRNGYAAYFCNILSEHDAKADMVKVIAYGTTNHPERDNAYGVLLGESRCD